MAGAQEIDRRADRGGGLERCEGALLAEIFQQHRAAQRIADRHDAVALQIVRDLLQHAAEVGRPAGMIVLAAIGPRRAGAAHIEAQDAVATIEQMARRAQDIGTVLAAGQAVDENY